MIARSLAGAAAVALLAGAPAAADPGRIALGTQAGITVIDAGALTAPPTLVVPHAEDASWSPDGTQLAFTRAFPADGLGVANADGTGARVLTTTVPPTSATDTAGFSDVQPSWAPDGSRLVFVRATLRRGDIWTVAADGTGAHQLILATGRDHIDTDPRFLADGSGLLFTRDDGDVWSARPDGSGLRRRVAASDIDVVASRDGREYALERGGDSYVIEHDGTRLHRVGGAGTTPIAFSGDGTRLVLGHTGADHKITGAATVVRTAGPGAPRALPHAPDGLTDIAFGAPSWFVPAAPRPSAAPADRAAPVSVVADDATGRMLALTDRTAHRTITMHTQQFASLLTVDATGVRSILVAWTYGDAKSRWIDVTKAGSFALNVPRTPGRYRLRVRTSDVLGHATRRPAEIGVRVVQ